MRGPLLFADIDTPGLTSIATYRKGGGYETAAALVGVKPPEDVIDIVKGLDRDGKLHGQLIIE